MRTRLLTVIIMFMLLVSSIIVSCSSDSNNKEIAIQVAKDWTSTEVNYITEDIVEEIYDEGMFKYSQILANVITLRPIIEDQVLNNLTWTYTEERKSSNVYYVDARTILNFEITQGTYSGNVRVDMGYTLTCNCEEKRVTNTSHCFGVMKFSEL